MTVELKEGFPKWALPEFHKWVQKDPTPVRKMSLDQFIEHYSLELDRTPSWGIWVDGKVKGIITLEPFGQGGDPTPINSSGTIALAPEVRGERILHHYLPITFEKFFQDYPQVNRMSALLIEDNWPERKLLEKLKFVHEGTLREATELDGKFHNLVLYGLTRKDYFNGLL